MTKVYTRNEAHEVVAKTLSERMTKSNAKIWTPIINAFVDKIVDGKSSKYMDPVMTIEKAIGGVTIKIR